MGSSSKTPEMVFTKIFSVIFGLTLIGSSFGVFQSFHPKINEIYVPTMKTSTFNDFINGQLNPSISTKIVKRHWTNPTRTFQSRSGQVQTIHPPQPQAKTRTPLPYYAMISGL